MPDNTNDPLDLLFREKLSAPASAGPMGDWPALQERVSAHFARDKRRRRFLLFFLLIGLTTTAFFLYDLPSKNTKQETAVSKSKATAQSSADENRSPHLANGNVGPKANGAFTVDKNNFISLNETSAFQKNTTAIQRPYKKRKQNISLETAESEYLLPTDDEDVLTGISNSDTSASAGTVASTETRQKDSKPKKEKSPVAEPAEPETAKGDFIWVDIHSGLNRTSPILSGSLGQPGYFDKRRQEESAGVHAGYGVYIRFKVKRIIGSFGVDIVQYGEKVDYSDKATKRFSQVSGGQFMYNDSVVTNSAFLAAEKNQLTYIEIPLYAGYEFPTRSKFGYSVTGGVAMGFLAVSRATYIDTALTGARRFENEKKENFRGQTFSIGLQPSLEYRMRSFSELYVAFPIRYQLTSVNHIDSYVRQRYLSPGIQLGWRIYVTSK